MPLFNTAFQAGLFNTAFQIGGAVFVAIVSAVISSDTGAGGGGEARGILDAMRPALTILIPAALAGTVVLFIVRQRGTQTEGTGVLLPETEVS